MLVVLAAAASYILGALPFGLWVGKIAKGIDIRDFGSGNIGASNVLRTLGPGLGFLVFVLDTAKGLAAILVCRGMGLDEWWVVACGLLSVLGHTFSVFTGFKGGKGVATSLGVIIGLDPIIAAVAFLLWIVLVAATRYISLASVLAAASVPVQMFFWEARGVHSAYKSLAVLAALLILVRHRSNIRRLLSGTEPRFGERINVARSELNAEGDEDGRKGQTGA